MNGKGTGTRFHWEVHAHRYRERERERCARSALDELLLVGDSFAEFVDTFAAQSILERPHRMVCDTVTRTSTNTGTGTGTGMDTGTGTGTRA